MIPAATAPREQPGARLPIAPPPLRQSIPSRTDATSPSTRESTPRIQLLSSSSCSHPWRSSLIPDPSRGRTKPDSRGQSPMEHPFTGTDADQRNPAERGILYPNGQPCPVSIGQNAGSGAAKDPGGRDWYTSAVFHGRPGGSRRRVNRRWTWRRGVWSESGSNQIGDGRVGGPLGCRPG